MSTGSLYKAPAPGDRPFDAGRRGFHRSNGFIALLLVAWLLPGLVGHDPWKPDEAYSFGLVYSALRDPGVVPVLAGEPFVEKPPLYYFTSAAIARLLSPPLAPHDAARLATAFYLAIAALFVLLTARTLFDDAAGRLAVVLLLGSLGFLVRGHQLITDAALVAGFAIGLYGLARSIERPVAGGLWLGTGSGIGFMAKGLLAPGILGITALLLPLIAHAWRRRDYVLTLGLGLAAAAPWLLAWPLALYHVSPPLFHEWFWDNNFGRFLGTSHLGPKAEHGHYLTILPWYTLPVLPLAALTTWRARRSMTDGVRLLATVFVVMLAVLSVSADARELYAMPLLLPLAILAAPAACDLPRRGARFWYALGIGGFGVLILAAWLGWFALELGVPASMHRMLLERSPAYEPHVRWFPVLVAAGYTAVWVALIRRLRSNTQERSAIAWTAGVTVTWALAMTLYIGWLDASKTYRGVASSLRSALPNSYDCIASRGLGEPQRAMFDYFANIVTYREEAPQRRRRCELMLVQHSAGEKVESDNVLWRGGRPGDANERFVLYRVTR